VGMRSGSFRAGSPMDSRAQFRGMLSSSSDDETAEDRLQWAGADPGGKGTVSNPSNGAGISRSSLAGPSPRAATSRSLPPRDPVTGKRLWPKFGGYAAIAKPTGADDGVVGSIVSLDVSRTKHASSRGPAPPNAQPQDGSTKPSSHLSGKLPAEEARIERERRKTARRERELRVERALRRSVSPAERSGTSDVEPSTASDPNDGVEDTHPRVEAAAAARRAQEQKTAAAVVEARRAEEAAEEARRAEKQAAAEEEAQKAEEQAAAAAAADAEARWVEEEAVVAAEARRAEQARRAEAEAEEARRAEEAAVAAAEARRAEQARRAEAAAEEEARRAREEQELRARVETESVAAAAQRDDEVRLRQAAGEEDRGRRDERVQLAAESDKPDLPDDDEEQAYYEDDFEDDAEPAALVGSDDGTAANNAGGTAVSLEDALKMLDEQYPSDGEEKKPWWYEEDGDPDDTEGAGMRDEASVHDAFGEQDGAVDAEAPVAAAAGSDDGTVANNAGGTAVSLEDALKMLDEQYPSDGEEKKPWWYEEDAIEPGGFDADNGASLSLEHRSGARGAGEDGEQVGSVHAAANPARGGSRSRRGSMDPDEVLRWLAPDTSGPSGPGEGSGSPLPSAGRGGAGDVGERAAGAASARWSSASPSASDTSSRAGQQAWRPRGDGALRRERVGAPEAVAWARAGSDGSPAGADGEGWAALTSLQRAAELQARGGGGRHAFSPDAAKGAARRASEMQQRREQDAARAAARAAGRAEGEGADLAGAVLADLRRAGSGALDAFTRVASGALEVLSRSGSSEASDTPGRGRPAARGGGVDAGARARAERSPAGDGVMFLRSAPRRLRRASAAAAHPAPKSGLVAPLEPEWGVLVGTAVGDFVGALVGGCRPCPPTPPLTRPSAPRPPLAGADRPSRARAGRSRGCWWRSRRCCTWR
jgi:chemotaxis protein histidine kinase CheA